MSAIERSWETDGALATLLRPVGALHRVLAAGRNAAYRAGWLRVVPSPLPVIVVGNLSVGGTGKTPLTACLVGELRRRGWRPGIVSRGYGGARHESPRHVRADDVSSDVGDEPLMLSRETGAPVCVCVHRARAVAAIARDTDCDLVLSDDGLQHRRMARDAEIVVVDEAQGFGNGRLLPAGPLRELPSRLAGVDLVALREPTVARGTSAEADGPVPSIAGLPGAVALEHVSLPPAFRFSLDDPHVTRWPDGERVPLATFAGRSVHAVAGIARPERFFSMLRDHGLVPDVRALPDHHAIVAADLAFADADPVLVTRKDAVRLDGIAPLPSALHVVDVGVRMDAAAGPLIDALSEALGKTPGDAVSDAVSDVTDDVRGGGPDTTSRPRSGGASHEESDGGRMP